MYKRQQYWFDHKFDEALYLDKAFVKRKLEVAKQAFENRKDLALKMAGPAVIEIFGENPFEPESKKEAYKLTKEQQKLSAGYINEYQRIVQEHIPGDERSFTTVSYTHLDVYKRQGNDYSYIGAVVGATYPEMGKVLRKVMPKSYILVPGYGAQGGTAEGLKPYFNEDGLGAIVNSSRGIICAYKQDKYAKFGAENYADASRQAVIDMIEDINSIF